MLKLVSRSEVPHFNKDSKIEGGKYLLTALDFFGTCSTSFFIEVKLSFRMTEILTGQYEEASTKKHIPMKMVWYSSWTKV